MSTELERLLVSLEASMTKYERTMNKALALGNQRANQIEKRWAKLELGATAFAGLTRGATQAIVPLLSITAAINGTRAALQKYGDIADQSKAAGLDAEFYQGITHQASLAGIEIGSMSSALSTFNRLSGQAVEGRGKMVTQLQAEHAELLEGIQAATTQEERFRLVADAIKAARDQSEAAVIAAAAFGDQGEEIAAAFRGGTEEIDRTIAKARELGLIVDRELIAKADEYGDQWDSAAQIIDTKVKVALINLAPGMIWLLDRVVDLANEAERFGAAMSSPRDFFAWLGGGSGVESRLGDVRDDLRESAIGSRFGIKVDKVGDGPLARDLEELFKVKLREAVKGIEAAPIIGANWGDAAGLGGGVRGAGGVGGTGTVGGPLDFRAFLDKQYGDSLEGYPDIYRDAATAANQATSAVSAHSLAVDVLNGRIEQQRQLWDQVGQIGRAAIEGIVDALSDGKVEGNEMLAILSNILGMGGSYFLDQAFGGLGSLFGGGVGSAYRPGGWGSSGLSRRALGGPVSAGQPYIVGEKRPELFVPNVGGRIVPQVPGSERSGPMSFSFHISGGDNRLAEFVRFQLPGLIRNAINDPHAVG